MAARISLGADIDLVEAYEWALGRAAPASRPRWRPRPTGCSPGASIEEATAILDQTEYVTGADAYRAWLQERHDEAVERLDGVHFDIAPPLRAVDAVLATGSSSGAAYYTAPSEDLTRPGRTWWPLAADRERFEVWAELTTVFHEGVPGHHLQLGAARVAGDTLSRFAKRSASSAGTARAGRCTPSGWPTSSAGSPSPGTRLGMLSGSALRAARVVIDIGLHLDLPLPAEEAAGTAPGGRSSGHARCCASAAGREPHRVHPEVVRYCGWPAQAISYKLGERGWLAARERGAARRGPAFDLKRWHTEALALGPVGLSTLTDALASLESR